MPKFTIKLDDELDAGEFGAPFVQTCAANPIRVGGPDPPESQSPRESNDEDAPEFPEEPCWSLLSTESMSGPCLCTLSVSGRKEARRLDLDAGAMESLAKLPTDASDSIILKASGSSIRDPSDYCAIVAKRTLKVLEQEPDRSNDDYEDQQQQQPNECDGDYEDQQQQQQQRSECNDDCVEHFRRDVEGDGRLWRSCEEPSQDIVAWDAEPSQDTVAWDAHEEEEEEEEEEELVE